MPPKVNGNTPTYQQIFSIKLWWYGGVIPLTFGGMVEYFH
jgi:hypothetical protein